MSFLHSCTALPTPHSAQVTLTQIQQTVPQVATTTTLVSPLSPSVAACGLEREGPREPSGSWEGSPNRRDRGLHQAPSRELTRNGLVGRASGNWGPQTPLPRSS